MSLERDKLEEMLTKLKYYFDMVNNELESAPSGRLMCCASHGKDSFVVQDNVGGKRKRVTANGNIDLLKVHARKAYLQKADKSMETDIRLLKHALEKFEGYSPEEIVKELPRAYQMLPMEYFYSKLDAGNGSGQGGSGAEQLAGSREGRMKKHEEWASRDYEKSNYRPEQLTQTTSRGFKVRSKSELMIEEELIIYGVPHRYEQVLRLGGRVFVPEFTFRDRYGEEFYWEHAGMMDDDVYQGRHKRKMKDYEYFGIVPWKNLIVTYDNDGDANLPLIKSIIEHSVLPRL